MVLATWNPTNRRFRIDKYKVMSESTVEATSPVKDSILRIPLMCCKKKGMIVGEQMIQMTIKTPKKRQIKKRMNKLIRLHSKYKVKKNRKALIKTKWNIQEMKQISITMKVVQVLSHHNTKNEKMNQQKPRKHQVWNCALYKMINNWYISRMMEYSSHLK